MEELAPVTPLVNEQSPVTKPSDTRRRTYYILSFLVVITILLIISIGIFFVIRQNTSKDAFVVGRVYEGVWNSTQPIFSKLTVTSREADKVIVCYEWQQGNSGGNIANLATIENNTLFWGDEQIPNKFFFSFSPNNRGLDGKMKYNNNYSTIRMEPVNVILPTNNSKCKN